MSIEFQNGFVCGMATKGFVRSGDPYKPTAWNDVGVYDFFYIDFKRSLSQFSSAEFRESISITSGAYVLSASLSLFSPGVYKVYCDITNAIRGIFVTNKPGCLLSFASGQQVPAFVLKMLVSRPVPYLDYVDFFSEEATVAIDGVFVSHATETETITLT